MPKPWREAKSLLTFLAQYDALYPFRSKVSDGTIGDLRHQEDKSDHNPNEADVVTAVDITNDPINAVPSRQLANALVASRDKRIKYIISDGEILSSVVAPWTWRKYHGSNGHYHHVHISVLGSPALYDSAASWDLSALPTRAANQTPLPVMSEYLRAGSKGMSVLALQHALKIKEDGVFGPNTEKAVKAFQAEHGLREDGVVGPNTRKELGL